MDHKVAARAIVRAIDLMVREAIHIIRMVVLIKVGIIKIHTGRGAPVPEKIT